MQPRLAVFAGRGCCFEHTELPLETATDQTLCNAVRHDRRVELNFEIHRYFDLVRWGLGVFYRIYSREDEVFPLPQTEIELNPFLSQNSGY